MSIGAQSPFLRRALFRAFSSVYLRRKVTTPDGRFEAFLSPGSSLKVLRPKMEMERVHQRFIRDWIETDSIVWDVGLNLGLFALPAALKAARGHVYGFEPDADLIANILRSLRLPANKGLRVSPYCVAVSDADGTARFQISKFSRAMSKLEHVGRWHDEQIVADQVRPVVTMRVDTLARTIPPPSVMKIDVEGAEMHVLNGAVETIATHRPAILIEGPREVWDQMGTFFRDRDYLLFDGASDERRALEHPVWDTFAIPREKISPTGAGS
jgi:FkbM family methyltransferase